MTDSQTGFFHNMPGIIAQAAKSPLGITALVILGLCLVALSLFGHDDPWQLRIAVFVVMIGALGGFVLLAFTRADPNKAPAKALRAPAPSKIVKDTKAGVDEIKATLNGEVKATLEIKASVTELLEFAKSGGMFQRAAEQGLSEAALRAVVGKLGGEGIGKDDLISWLEQWIDTAQEKLGRQTNEGEAFETARQEAENLFQQGDLDNASAALMAAFERDRKADLERQEDNKHRQLRLLEEAIRFDELALNGPAAALKLRKMSEIEGISGQDELGEWLCDKAREFYDRGLQKGDNGALIVAIATYHTAQEEYTRNRVPHGWATIQNDLGNALVTLGERESGTERLEQAVETYRAALEEKSRDRVPLDWAKIQSNIGNALAILGERKDETKQLEQAVEAYRAALEEQTRERVPFDWAKTQTNLGTALQELGKRESRIQRLEQAAEAYRAALVVQPRDRVPLDWAGTQNNLGIALQELGKWESGTERLEQAVKAYRAALEERTRDRVPLDWGATQSNLGNALAILGERESGTERLKQAVESYRAALEEYTRDRVPLDWAMTTGNLGVALTILAERRKDQDMAAKAVNMIETAFALFRDAGHAPYATIYQSHLPEARAILAQLETASP